MVVLRIMNVFTKGLFVAEGEEATGIRIVLYCTRSSQFVNSQSTLHSRRICIVEHKRRKAGVGFNAATRNGLTCLKRYQVDRS